jgi:hypothetical protein
VVGGFPSAGTFIESVLHSQGNQPVLNSIGNFRNCDFMFSEKWNDGLDAPGGTSSNVRADLQAFFCRIAQSKTSSALHEERLRGGTS